MRRIALALSLATLLGSCYGTFGLTRKVYGFNGRATGNAFVNSAIMWGLFIIPVYELAGMADILIFNTIEVFTGSNPVAVNDAGGVEVKHGNAVWRFRQIDERTIAVSRDGVLRGHARLRDDGSMALCDRADRTLLVVPASSVPPLHDGDVATL